MVTLHELEQRVAVIEERNHRVEIDKAWETSATRRAIVIAATYIVIGVFFMMIDVRLPWLNAIVPAVGFALSTVVLHPARKRWERHRRQ